MSGPGTAGGGIGGHATATAAADRRAAAARAIDSTGTPESHWTEWRGLRSLPVATLPGGPVLVVAAHPDDEVLGFGGTMAELTAAGVPCHLLSVTDGERSHPRPTRSAARRLGGRRRAELAAALGELGLGALRPRYLSVPDTAVERYEDHVRDAVAGMLRETGAVLCVAPWTGDLHSDHEAAGRAAATACADTGVPLWCYPVWLWHWSFPADPRVPWDRAARLPLTDAAAARKRLAAGRFVSQIEPLGDGSRAGSGGAAILPPGELAHHTRNFEVVFR